MIFMEEDGLTWRLSPGPDLIGNPLIPAVHGGAVTAFLELACGAVVAHRLNLSVLPRLVSVNIQFLAPTRLRDLVARPVIRRIGKRAAVVHADTWQENPGAPVCTAQCDFSLSPL